MTGGGAARQRGAGPNSRYPWSFRLRISDADMAWIKETAVDMKMTQQEIVRWGLHLLQEELDRVQGEGGIASSLIQSSVDVSKVKPQKPSKPKYGTKTPVLKPEKDPSKRDLRSVEDRALGKLASLTRKIENERPSDS